MSDSSKKLKQDRLVEQMVPDPAKLQPGVQLSGWLGRSNTEGTWRLYLNPRFDEYVEFAESDILNTQPLGDDESSLGGTLVWLKSGANSQHTRVVSRQVQADFLAGGIAARYLTGASPSFGSSPGRVGAVGTAGVNCSANPHIPACRPVTDGCYKSIGCSSDYGCTGPFCPTREFVCGYSAGCTVGQECSIGCAAT